MKHKGFQLCQPNFYSAVQELTDVRCSEPTERLYTCSLSKHLVTFIRFQKTYGKHLAHLQTKGSVFDIPLAIWSSIWNLNKIFAHPTSFRRMTESLGSFVSVSFLTARGSTTTGKHRRALKNRTVLVGVMLDSSSWHTAWIILQNFTHSPCLDVYIQLKVKICPNAEYGYFYVGITLCPLEELTAPCTI